jgi:hypothetical protein
MITAINDHFCDLYGRIRLNGEPIAVYGHGAARPKGLTKLCCVAVSYLGFRIQHEFARDTEILTPNPTQISVSVPPELGHRFHTTVTSTKQEPYQIPESGLWGMQVRVSKGHGWKAPAIACPMPGERSAVEVARSLNYWLPGVIAWATGDGRVTIQTIEQGIDLEIVDFATSLHEVLGFEVGVQSHLDRTGPATWTVKPHPLPIELHWQTDFLSADAAQNDAFLPIALNAVPHRHWVRINGTDLRFDADTPTNLDELEKPLFRTALTWWGGTLWVESLAQYEVSSILAPSIEWAG